MTIHEDQAIDFIRRSARVRVHSGALGCEDMVMAEGKAIAWCAAPSLTIEHDDGTKSSWSTQLPITEVEQPEWPKAEPYAIYSRWATAGDSSSKAVWGVIQQAYAAGQESGAPEEAKR